MTSRQARLAVAVLLSLSPGCGARRGGDSTVFVSNVPAGTSDVTRPDADAGSPALDASVPTPNPMTTSRASVVAGRPCAGVGSCGSDADGLTCAQLPGGRICSSREFCSQGTTSQEESQCGGRDSTCLVIGTLINGTQASACTRSCVLMANTEATGACPFGSICTTNWLHLGVGQAESPGCLPFCTSDSDCRDTPAGAASPMRCNTRTGRCDSAPAGLRLGPDGTACNPQEMRRTAVNPCRGTCLSLDPGRPTRGLCGSFIDLRTATGGCPDGAAIEPRAPPGDALGVCMFRNCTSNAQCPRGLLCVYPEDATTGVHTDVPPSCGYASPRQPRGVPRALADAGTV